ncbi:MAG: HK97 family phage prohead protease [Oscillospiraceae bacterium]|nr:HK97 family phage prohead protease [Oscillospiraceae bacterium]
MKIEIRADNSVHIEGYVNAVERDSNIINVPSVGRCVEQIRAGAFGQALSSGADVAILENHDISRKLGSTSQGNLKLCEDNIGLRASANITDEDIVGKARRGELRGWSFGFVCTDSEIEQRAGNVPRRIVKGMTLSEVSLIDGAYKPCYNGTLVEVRSEGNFMEYRSCADEATEIIVEERAGDVDYSYYDALLRYCELRYNPYHDDKGRFCSGGGGGGGMLVVPKGQKGKGFYVGASDRDIAEQALANEFEEWVKSRNTVPDAIQAKVQKVRDMVNKSSAFGDLEGDIQVSIDENGNYNLSYTQVKNYDRLKSATIGVGDIPARKETTYTTYTFNSEGKRISTNRKTDTEYFKSTKAPKTGSDDWTGANANMGTSRTATRRTKNAINWADMQVRRAEEDTDPDDPV